MRKVLWKMAGVGLAIWCGTGLAGCGDRRIPQAQVSWEDGELVCTEAAWTSEEEASWRDYMEEYGENLSYLELGTELTVSFDGEKPEGLEVRDSVIDEEGNLRYEDRVTEIRDCRWQEDQEAYTFYLSGHFGSVLSPDLADYEPGACLRGLEINYRWDGKDYTSRFVVRTDAGLM